MFEHASRWKGSKTTIADLPSTPGAVLIVAGMLLVLVQYFFRPPTNNPAIYGVLVTIIIVGAALLGVGSVVHR